MVTRGGKKIGERRLPTVIFSENFNSPRVLTSSVRVLICSTGDLYLQGLWWLLIMWEFTKIDYAVHHQEHNLYNTRRDLSPRRVPLILCVCRKNFLYGDSVADY